MTGRSCAIVRPAAERLGIYHPGFGSRALRRLNLSGIQRGSERVSVFEAME